VWTRRLAWRPLRFSTPSTPATRGFGVDRCHLALDGDLCSAVDRDKIGKALTGWSVSEQRGDSLAARLVDAHADLAAAAPGPVIQIGMDTPQVTPEHLAAVVVALGDGAAAARADAVLGPAPDGGWWVLALRDSADAASLSGVAMSTPTTCADTGKALTNSGLRVVATTTLRDVDTVTDAAAVAHDAPNTRFAEVWATVASHISAQRPCE
jgi:glycosyltransferase A (GT-A) superfamily protein (DUF2064 family)